MTGIPKNHTRLTAEDLDRITIDDGKRLYWHGKLIKTELSFTPLQKMVGGTVVALTALASIATIVAAVRPFMDDVTKVRILADSAPLKLDAQSAPLLPAHTFQVAPEPGAPSAHVTPIDK